jgi:hypothetical protein
MSPSPLAMRRRNDDASGRHLTAMRCDPNLASSRRSLPAFATARLVELDLTGHGSVVHRPTS